MFQLTAHYSPSSELAAPLLLLALGLAGILLSLYLEFAPTDIL